MRNTLSILFFSLILLWGIPADLHAEPITGKKFTVVIDPGHGGNDPGAIVRKIKEKDIVLKLALKLGHYINQEMPDVEIVFTRENDVFIPLYQRAAKAINSKADLFLSLHVNSCATPSVSGTESYVLGMHRTEENLEVAKKENSVILIEDDYSTRYEGFDPNLSESYIMFDLVQEEYFNQSVSVAALVQNKFKNQAGRNDRGVKQAGFLVLRQTSMPSVLIEAGYLSNATEADYLNSDKGQDELAKAICDALKSYKTGFETRNDIKVTEVVAETQNGIEKQERKNELNKSLYYCIQIAVTNKKIDTKSTNFKGLNSVFVKEQKGIYKYYYGRETDYERILERKKEAKAHFRDAFVIAFLNDTQISLKEAMEMQKNK
ncbi:N-acetylmuramoyl-L-alanine amidase [Mangrovibacterium sp.]|uniref:N-acetylmuramoyl-L-alanine amidase family protein n=1 Tax=Mangrovibacterium sp. TaxID=1961364 RepID=UPI00356942B0